MTNRIKAAGVVLPILLGVMIFTLMQTQVIHKLFGIKVLQLPLPMDVLKAFGGNIQDILANAGTTIGPALAGMALGAVMGYGVALLVTAFPVGGYGGLFTMILINSVPIVALAPLMNRWFETPFLAKLVVIIVASSGAMAVNAFRGMNDVEQSRMDLMRINASGKWELFWKLLIPGSMPAVFTALKIIVPTGMLATIISEFFASETSGLGYMIKYSLKVGNQKQVGWAYIVAVSVLSITIYMMICCFERYLLKWHVSQKERK